MRLMAEGAGSAGLLLALFGLLGTAVLIVLWLHDVFVSKPQPDAVAGEEHTRSTDPLFNDVSGRKASCPRALVQDAGTLAPRARNSGSSC